MFTASARVRMARGTVHHASGAELAQTDEQKQTHTVCMHRNCGL